MQETFQLFLSMTFEKCKNYYYEKQLYCNSTKFQL